MRNILFCGNSKVFDGVLTCMLSVLKRTHATDPFCFYIFTMDMTRIRPEYTPISEDMTDFLERVAKKFHPQNRVISVDVRMKVLIVRHIHFCACWQIWCRECRINCCIWMRIFCFREISGCCMTRMCHMWNMPRQGIIMASI